MTSVEHLRSNPDADDVLAGLRARLSEQQRSTHVTANPGDATTHSTLPNGDNKADMEALRQALERLSDAELDTLLATLPPYRLARALERALAPDEAAASVGNNTIDGTTHADAPQNVEHRATQRTKAFRVGKIIYNNNMSVSNCEVRDISPDGCRLTVESIAGIPNCFTLHILNGGTKHECEVAWRKFNMIGVRFIG